MRIALISLPRVGSNFVFSKLIESFQYGHAREPYSNFSEDLTFNCFQVPENFILKTLHYHKPEYYSYELFYVQLVEYYDIKIFIDCLDKKRVLKSFAIALQSGEWFLKTDYNTEVSSFYMQKGERMLKKCYPLFRKYAEQYGLFTYEGLLKNKSEVQKFNDLLGRDVL